jgi:hypothetical protein
VTEILSDVVAEAERLLSLAEERSVQLRLLGGVGIRLRAGECFPDSLARPYGDLDFAAAKGSSTTLGRLLAEAGYEPDREFNTLRGKERLLFYDLANGRKIDVFVGSFSMCHEIPLADRLDVDQQTIPLAELLLTKLQVVELNEKDVTDALALLATHELGDTDGDAINAHRIATLCGADWGLWRTFTSNLADCRERVDSHLDGVEARDVRERLDGLLARIDTQPKSRGWRLRARIGERVRWYELPEEIGEGAL